MAVVHNEMMMKNPRDEASVNTLLMAKLRAH
jgi:hypothetical protein